MEKRKHVGGRGRRVDIYRDIMIEGEKIEEIWANLKRKVEESIIKKRIYNRKRKRKIREKRIVGY